MQLFRALKKITLTAVVLLFFLAAAGHAHEGHMPIIVDTDAAVDDIRALALLLEAGADIRLIVTSDGVLPPQEGRKTVRRILSYFDRSDIPVAAGQSTDGPPPEWRKWNSNLNWPKEAEIDKPGNLKPVSAKTAIIDRIKTISKNREKALYLCLGPMTNLAEALKSAPRIKKGIERVVYLGGAPASESPGWNTRRDADAARHVFESGLSIYALGLEENQYPAFNKSFYERITSYQSNPASLITCIHQNKALEEKMAENHLRIWDELAAIYLYYPDLFEFTAGRTKAGVMRLADYNKDKLLEKYLSMLESPMGHEMDPRQSVILKSFPTEPSRFKNDLAPHVTEIIKAYGLEEWKACLLTNELHRHLGIYSLVGAKMGVRAREILNAPFDSLRVVSFTGSEPPLSCLNDGLQASTGASLGRGSIRIAKSRSEPAAMFVRNQRVLYLTLKPQYVKRIKKDIQSALKRFGGLNPDYFAHIRKLSIEYWMDFDRTELFEEKIKSN